MENKLREAALRDELSERETMCSELRESAKQLETAHSDDLTKRGVELLYTKNLLKEAQANFALLEGKEAMAKEDVVLHERVAPDPQDKYEREVVEHGRTVEGFCCSKDAVNSQSQATNCRATSH